MRASASDGKTELEILKETLKSEGVIIALEVIAAALNEARESHGEE